MHQTAQPFPVAFQREPLNKSVTRHNNHKTANDESLVESYHRVPAKRQSNILDNSMNRNNISELSNIDNDVQNLNNKLERKITKLIEENNRLNEIINKNFKEKHSKINLETDNYQLNQIVKQLTTQLEEKDHLLDSLQKKVPSEDHFQKEKEVFQSKIDDLVSKHQSGLSQQQLYEDQILKKLNEMIDENNGLCQIIEQQTGTINQQQVSLQKQSLVE